MSNSTPVSGIYIILNTKTGKVYIGQSQNLHKRLATHKSMLRRGCHDNPHLQRAWNKYGEKAFKFQKLEYCSMDQLDEREQHFLDTYIPKGMCYNISIDAIAPMRGRIPTDDHRRKLSEAGKRQPPKSTETRRRLSESQKGKVFSEETRRKMSEAQKGEKSHLFGKKRDKEIGRKVSASKMGHAVSEETREKLRPANMGKKHSDEHRRNISEGNKRRWAKIKAERESTLAGLE